MFIYSNGLPLKKIDSHWISSYNRVCFKREMEEGHHHFNLEILQTYGLFSRLQGIGTVC